MSVYSIGLQTVLKRLVHSCGMIDIVGDFACSEKALEAGVSALKAGGEVYVDVEMVRAGIIERMLPNQNEIVCTLNDVRVRPHAEEVGNTRSAAAVDFWAGSMENAVVVIGNAPTALFRLLERVAAREISPALVIGIPVGFVGAVESKQALAENRYGLNFMTVHGRRGGSAMAASVLNALAGVANG